MLIILVESQYSNNAMDIYSKDLLFIGKWCLIHLKIIKKASLFEMLFYFFEFEEDYASNGTTET